MAYDWVDAEAVVGESIDELDSLIFIKSWKLHRNRQQHDFRNDLEDISCNKSSEQTAKTFIKN
jgi:hypothetical protein